jgi:hypothetical protein
VHFHYILICVEFPQPLFGSYEVLGLDDVSFDRFGRYGAYGYGENDTENWEPPSMVNWDDVNWAKLQLQCFEGNKHRFKLQSSVHKSRQSFKVQSPQSPGYAARIPHRERTALILRSFTDVTWMANDIYNLRSLITELSLHSGGEYEVFLLVHVKDAEFDVESPVHGALIKEQYIPKEFHDISILFNDATLEKLYPNVSEHRYYQPQIYLVLAANMAQTNLSALPAGTVFL